MFSHDVQKFAVINGVRNKKDEEQRDWKEVRDGGKDRRRRIHLRISLKIQVLEG